MLLRCYSVYDESTEAFGIPFFFVNDRTAERSFGILVNDPQSMISKYPQDYSLYCFGQFDDSTGRFSLYDRPELIGRAPSFVQARLDGTPREESSHA